MITLTKDEVKAKTAQILARYTGEKDELIPILQETQEEFRHLPAEAMREISRFLRVSESMVYGVSTFYAQFRLTPSGKNIVRVCRGTACHVRGSAAILEELEKQLGIKAGGTTEDMEYSLETINCFGSCALAPVVVINKNIYGRMTVHKVGPILNKNK